MGFGLFGSCSSLLCTVVTFVCYMWILFVGGLVGLFVGWVWLPVGLGYLVGGFVDFGSGLLLWFP